MEENPELEPTLPFNQFVPSHILSCSSILILVYDCILVSPGSRYKCNPFAGSSHAKGIVVEKIGIEAKGWKDGINGGFEGP